MFRIIIQNIVNGDEHIWHLDQEAGESIDHLLQATQGPPRLAHLVRTETTDSEGNTLREEYP